MWIVGLAGVGLAGCGKSTPNASSAAGSNRATALAPSEVDLYVNDQAIAHVPVSVLQGWPRLETLVPPPMRRLRTWDELVVKTSQPTPWQLHRPSETSPHLVPALFVGADQIPAFGMFAPGELARHGKPEVRQDAVTEVRISVTLGDSHPEGDGGRASENFSGDNSGNGSGSGSGDAAAPADLKVSVKAPKGTSTLSGQTLMAIPRDPMPGENEPLGWTLASVVKAAGIGTFAKIRLTDMDGVSVVLDRTDFGATSIPYVKLNRKGLLRVQVYKKKGSSWERSGDLRGLTSIEQLE